MTRDSLNPHRSSVIGLPPNHAWGFSESMDTQHFSQEQYTIRCEWGIQGVAALEAHSDVMIIVDVLSFSTCVDVAVGRDALIFPYPTMDEAAAAYAASLGAALAKRRQDTPGGYSLSPTSLQAIPAGTRLVLPSPNGSRLSRATGSVPTLAGCLRNAGVVARAAQQLGRRISVIPAGERWPDGSLRPSLEDWLGAGAIIGHMSGTLSPEAEAAWHTFQALVPRLGEFLRQCGSGRELIERGFAEDVELAAQLDVSDCAPVLREDAYRRYQ